MAKKKKQSSAVIGDLFADGQSTPPQPATAGKASGCLPVIVMALVIVLALAAWSKFGPTPDGGDHKQDQHGQRDDQSIAGKTGYLIFIHERSEMSAADADTLDMAEAFCESHAGLEHRSVDDDDPSDAVKKLIAFAASKGITPPCVVYKSKDNTHRSAAKWPTSEADLKGVLSKR